MAEFHFFHPVEVRYDDLDPQGHLNNAKYLTYFEQARIHYLIHLGLFKDGGSFMDVGIILADAQVTFLSIVRWEQDVRIGVRISRLGNKSMDSEYLMVDGGTHQEIATGSSVLVAYDYRKGKTIPIPEEWRNKISKFEKISTQ